MRDELKNLFSKEIILEDGSHYFYTIQPFEMKNMLGAIVAVLDEYSFTKKGSSETYRLYRTKDGNWYDVNAESLTHQKGTLRIFKSAIDDQKAEKYSD